ncbi:MAG: DUF455 family protein [Leptospiraceae bacterium]|nr:DUF455 family protein [Leptospiraceae bacterium]
MEIREFAEGLLFEPGLDNKLRSITAWTDHHPGPVRSIPAWPHRTAELGLQQQRKRSSFPSLHQLEQSPTERGKVFHFFANHELLAIEIMALILLRFPEADPAFRESILHTIFEEQKHMRLYLHQMLRCGLEFGALGVNDFFWRACANQTELSQILLILGLTFEQANLDYCLKYIQAFQRIADLDSVNVLQIVHADEVGHVANSLRWIQRWHPDSRRDLWEYYAQNLPWPINPVRARGSQAPFDVEGRTKAGLDTGFIQQLRTHGYSRGKIPTIWYFRGGQESDFYKLKNEAAKRTQIQATLGQLYLWTAANDDIVVSSRRPTTELQQRLLEFRTQLPQILAPAQLKDWQNRKAGSLEFWLWNQNDFQEYKTLIDHSPVWQQQRLGNIQQRPEFGYHRQRSIDLEARLADQCNHASLEFAQGRILSAHQIDEYIKSATAGAWIVKPVFSAAGRGQIRLDEQDCRQWLESRARRQLLHNGPTQEWLLEKRYQKVCDLCFLYDAHPNGQYFQKGILQFETNNAGGYRGHIIARYSQVMTPDQLKLLHQRDSSGRTLVALLAESIQTALPEIWPQWRGPVGVDAMLIQDKGRLKLRPVVEVNFRRTMGHLALSLGRILYPGRQGRLQLGSLPNPEPWQARDQKLFQGDLPLLDTNGNGPQAWLRVMPN